MKTTSAALASHIRRECTTLAMAVKLVQTRHQPAIVSITKANPGVIETEWAPGYLTGDSARIFGVRGMTELAGQDVTLTRIDDTHFSIGVDTSAYSNYTSHGELRRVLGYTQHIRDFSFEGVLYRAGIGYMPRSIKGGSDLSVDNLEIVGLMPNKVKAVAQGILLKGLSDEDIEVGRFDHARVELFYINYTDLTQSRMILPGSGRIGQIRMLRGTHESELRGLTSYLAQNVGDIYSKLCRARLGDDVGDGTGAHDYKKRGFGCKVRLNPPFWRANTAYTVRPPYDAAVGSVVKSEDFFVSGMINRHFKCTVAGTSHATTEPTWPTRIGDTVVDGTVTWEAIQSLRVFGAVTAVLDRRFFSDDLRSEPPASGLGINTATALYAIRAANTTSDFFALDGDLRSLFPVGATFVVSDSEENDGTYTVQSTVLHQARTRITVDEDIPGSQDSGFIRAPSLVSSGFFQYGLLTFLIGANKGISKEVKDFTLTRYPIVNVDTVLKLFMLEGDVAGFFAMNQRIAVNNSTGNDDVYDIVSINYNIGTDQTEIEVFQAIPDATVDGDILAGPGQFELFERMPFEIEVGDEYVVTAGCDLSKELCKVRFDNILNRRAEDEVPGSDVALLVTAQSGGSG